MNFIKRNKSIIIAIVIFLILVLVLFQLKTIFFPNTGKAIYGNRLDGIENVKISSETFNNVKSKLEGEGVSNVSISLDLKFDCDVMVLQTNSFSTQGNPGWLLECPVGELSSNKNVEIRKESIGFEIY